jgi:hypothetical protein
MRDRDRVFIETVRLPRHTCVQTFRRTYFQPDVDRLEMRGYDIAVPTAPIRRSTLPPTFPAALEFQCRIKTLIDQSSAAGDALDAVLTTPIRDRCGVILAPAGSPIRGRLIRMTHHYGSKEHFEFGIRLESINIDGALVPFAAETPHAVALGSTGRLRSRAKLIFPGRCSRTSATSSSPAGD